MSRVYLHLVTSGPEVLSTFGLVTLEELKVIENFISTQGGFLDETGEGTIDPKINSVEDDAKRITRLVKFFGENQYNKIDLIDRTVKEGYLIPLRRRIDVLMQSPNEEIASKSEQITEDFEDYIGDVITYEILENRVLELEQLNVIVPNPERFLGVQNPNRQDLDLGNIIKLYF